MDINQGGEMQDLAGYREFTYLLNTIKKRAKIKKAAYIYKYNKKKEEQAVHTSMNMRSRVQKSCTEMEWIRSSSHISVMTSCIPGMMEEIRDDILIKEIEICTEGRCLSITKDALEDAMNDNAKLVYIMGLQLTVKKKNDPAQEVHTKYIITPKHLEEKSLLNTKSIGGRICEPVPRYYCPNV